jgi:hypothetical protein
MCLFFTDDCDGREFLRDKSAGNSSGWRAGVGECSEENYPECGENGRGKVAQVRRRQSESGFLDPEI